MKLCLLFWLINSCFESCSHPRSAYRSPLEKRTSNFENYGVPKRAQIQVSKSSWKGKRLIKRRMEAKWSTFATVRFVWVKKCKNAMRWMHSKMVLFQRMPGAALEGRWTQTGMSSITSVCCRRSSEWPACEYTTMDNTLCNNSSILTWLFYDL